MNYELLSYERIVIYRRKQKELAELKHQYEILKEGYEDALKEKADNYCNTLLKQINDDANRKAQECVVENNDNVTADDTQIQTQPVIQTKELEFIKTSELIDTGKTLETEEDVDALINKLSCELKSKIRNNKRIKLS